MPWEPYVEYANFICKFGDNTNLLDLAEEVVIPALINHEQTRTFGSSTYFLFQTQMMDLDINGTQSLCVAGRFIKNTVITRRQIFDEAKGGIVQDTQEMSSAPSAVFVLILNNHKLLFYHETQGAPDLSAFKETVAKNLRTYYDRYARDQLALRQAEAARRAGHAVRAPALQSVFPRMTLEIIPLASEEDFASFIRALNLLTNVRIELVDTNDENDPNPFFEDMREKKDRIGSDKTALTHQNPTGLDKEEAITQLSAAAAQGNSHIALRGKDVAGDEIQRNAAYFKTRVLVPLVDHFEDMVDRLVRSFQAFQARGIHVEKDEENDGSDKQSAEAKIAAIRQRIGAGRG